LKNDDEAILDVKNVEELLAQAKAMEPALPGRSKISSFNRLDTILPHINVLLQLSLYAAVLIRKLQALCGEAWKSSSW
jgi:hypothetical protein